MAITIERVNIGKTNSKIPVRLLQLIMAAFRCVPSVWLLKLLIVMKCIRDLYQCMESILT